MGRTDLETYRDKALELFHEEEYSEAEYYFKWLTHEAPGFESWFYRGLSFKYLQMYESALHCFEKASNYRYKNHNLWYHMGFCYYHIGKYRTALEFINSSLEMYPNYYLALILKGMIDYILGDDDEYKETIQAVQASSSSPPFDYIPAYSAITSD